MKTCNGIIGNFETLDLQYIEKIEQGCRQQRSDFIFDSIKAIIGLPITLIQRVVGKKIAQVVRIQTKGVAII